MKFCFFLSALFALTIDATGMPQDELPLRIFGYFQNSFFMQTKNEFEPTHNSFGLQQLNLFFQRDISRQWRAFVNFEFLNTFSSARDWGAANIEEAWLRYRAGSHFNLKLGLLVPVFNQLNEIKNRTPLLPYVIRPLVYESSFSEIITVEAYIPTRAFAQVYGFLPAGQGKFEYAFYVGNSPNINNTPQQGQTGLDTTRTLLAGTRLGLRFGSLKFGISSTFDRVNFFEGLDPFVSQVPPTGLSEVPRIRLGADFSYFAGPFSIVGETIRVAYDDDLPEVSIDREFYYVTLFAQLNEQLQLYASYWHTDEDDTADLQSTPGVELEIINQSVFVPTFGAAYLFKDRINIKAQVGRVLWRRENRQDGRQDSNFYHLSTAVSVFF